MKKIIHSFIPVILVIPVIPVIIVIPLIPVIQVYLVIPVIACDHASPFIPVIFSLLSQRSRETKKINK